MTDASTPTASPWLDAARLVRELSRCDAYSHDVDRVDFRQTHISLLFFAGDRVYKVKRPVELGFLDFTTLERRCHFCTEEVRLNRRLAPDVYLGVVPITRQPDGHLSVNGPGEVVEWAVEMVRLPEHRMLSNLLARGEIDNEQMNAIASSLAEFHAQAPTGPGVDEHGSPAAIRANVEQNLLQLHPFVGAFEQGGVVTERQLCFLEQVSRGELAELESVFEARVDGGYVRDGHGDLHAENICLTTDGPIAYDCIEFNRYFRCGDVACDIAFLAMDLDFRGFPAFSRYLVKRYAALTDDEGARTLATFYKGYRALVRAKVAALTSKADGLNEEARDAQRRLSMRYVQLASAYRLPPALILMCGLPASGKSWLASQLAGPLRAAVLHSDVRRKILAGVSPHSSTPEEYETGLYSPENKRRTYRSLLATAITNLSSGHSTVVDATFSSREQRAEFVDAAARLNLPYYIAHVTAPEDVVRARLEARTSGADTSSDADLSVYLKARDTFEPPTESPSRHVVHVRSGEGPSEACSSTVLDRMIELEIGD